MESEKQEILSSIVKASANISWYFFLETFCCSLYTHASSSYSRCVTRLPLVPMAHGTSPVGSDFTWHFISFVWNSRSDHSYRKWKMKISEQTDSTTSIEDTLFIRNSKKVLSMYQYSNKRFQVKNNRKIFTRKPFSQHHSSS